MNTIKSWLSILVHYIFVANCDFCNRKLQGKDFNRICLRCAIRLENIKKQKICTCCFQLITPLTYKHPSNTQINICDECFKQEKILESNRSLFFNQGLAKKLIYDFKFQHHSSYSPIVVYWAVKKFKSYLNSFDIYVPIPLGKKGLYEREFCQVSKVTKSLAQIFKKPTKKIIIRNEKKYRKSQHHLSAKERKASIEEKYLYSPQYQNKLNKMKVLLIDDIYTTGSTIKNAATLIKKNNDEAKVGSFTFLRSILEE